MARKAYLYSTSLVLRWMVRLNIGVLLFVFAASPIVVPIFFNIANASGTTYYVDNCVTVGSDSNNGTSPSTPWLTINKVNTSSFNPGDSVLFQKTCTWREQLTVPSSGSAGNPITFGAYGSGAAPVISGANLLFSSWSLQSGNVWQVSLTTQPNQVFFNGTRGTLEASIGAITGPSEWYWASNVLYVYSTSNPSTAYTNPGIEASQRDYAIYGSSKTYVTVSGLELDKSNGTNGGLWCGSCNNLLVTGVSARWNFAVGISIYQGSGVVVTQSTAAYNGSSGLGSNTSPGILFDHDVSHDNCSLLNGSALSAGIYMYGASNNTTVQYSYSYNNGVGMGDSAGWYGLGIWADTLGSGFTAKYNLVANNNEEGIRIEAQTAFSVLYNVVYGTRGTSGAGWAGIDLAGTQSASAPMANSFVIGNTVYGGTSQGLIIQGAGVAGGCANNTVENNLIVGNDLAALVEFYASAGCENDGTNGSGNVYKYNSFDTAALDFIEWGTGTYYSTYSSWETATGNCGSGGCSHSVQSDPLFTNAAGGDFTLQSSSPAIDAGTNLGSPYNMGLDPRTSFPWSTIDQGIYGSWEIGAFVYVPNYSGSGNQTEPRYDFLNNSATSATSNHTIVFTVQNSLDNTGGSSSDTLAFTFQSNFNLANITCGDVNVATGTRFLFNVASPEPRTNCPNTATSWGLLVNTASRTITITVPATVRTYVATGTIITVSIGSNANSQNQGTHWIVNPSDAGTKSITIGGTFGGYGQILVSVNTPVQLSATVAETLTLAIAGMPGTGTGGMNSCSSDGTHDAEDSAAVNLVTTTAVTVPFGTLSSSNTFYEGCQKISIITNAGNGYTITTREDHSLRTASGLAIADTGCDANGCLNTPSTAAAWVTNTNSGLGISCANAATSASCWTVNPNWINGTRWAPLASEGNTNSTGGTQTPAVFSGLTGATSVEVITKAKYRIAVPTGQAAGTYTNLVSFIATPVY